MLLFTAPFVIAAVLIGIGCNPYAATAVAWFIMVAVIRGLTTED
jgi:hypothetical protein